MQLFITAMLQVFNLSSKQNSETQIWPLKDFEKNVF